MKTLLNVVHPHTFKLVDKTEGLTLVMGQHIKADYRKRDERVVAFIRRSLDSKQRVVVHNNFSNEMMRTLMQYGALSLDPLYDGVLSDDRIVKVDTNDAGYPIPDEKPVGLDSKFDEDWEHIKRHVTSHSKVKAVIRKPDNILFIGGVLEACLGNFAAYHADNYSHERQRLFYVPELCVSFDNERYEDMKKQLAKREINPINYDDAMEMLIEEILAKESQAAFSE